ncbi:hypothetical protein Pmani_027429 [Petrolisthes manimaculis]|uniref:Uncharacterized protein n=1 Tax=Petrolisthes manimaculis TaxID=1843537 RepID=A0AAE1P469_9EUCA|nr:hypothetical protein Pmani_027429 [Petrolisthes manimaculis]
MWARQQLGLRALTAKMLPRSHSHQGPPPSHPEGHNKRFSPTTRKRFTTFRYGPLSQRTFIPARIHPKTIYTSVTLPEHLHHLRLTAKWSVQTEQMR